MKFPRIKQKYACGPAACRFCVKHFLDKDIAEAVLIMEMRTDPKGMTTLPRNLMRVMRRYGLIVRSYHDMSIRSLCNHLDRGRFVITPYWNHYYVAVRADDDHIHFWEGLEGMVRRTREEFDLIWIDMDSEKNVYKHYGIVVRR